MTVLVVVAVTIGAWLWVRDFRTPPDDTAAHRRLMRELARHRVDIFHQSDH